MNALDRMLEREALERSPCVITVRRMKNGLILARMSFAPGMETAAALGKTVQEAMDGLAARLARGTV